MGVGFISSLVFKTKLLRSDSKHSPLEANMVCPVSSSICSAYGCCGLAAKQRGGLKAGVGHG